jgi:hypothetical protein
MPLHDPRSSIRIAAVLLLLVLARPAAAQLIATARTEGGVRPTVIFPTPGTRLPNPAQVEIAATAAAGLGPGPIGVYGSHFALLGDQFDAQVGVVDLKNGTVTGIVPTPDFGGFGSLAVAPSGAWALAFSEEILTVIRAPFTPASPVHTIPMPGFLGYWQTQAITFSTSGRAFAYHTGGISVLDPPYALILFTIPAANEFNGPIAISPDDQTLMVGQGYGGGPCSIFRAPFSAASTPEVVFTPISGIAGLAIAPNGQFAVAATYYDPTVFVINAPFGSSSLVESVPLTGPFWSDPGFEHVAISPASDLVVVTGGSGTLNSTPYLFIEAPFTAAGAILHAVVPTGGFDRGTGSAAFVPASLFADSFESGDTSAWSLTIP